MIGEWEITFAIYDTYKPGEPPVYTETGTQTCEYGLDLNGTSMFIICTGTVVSTKGRTRSFQESIRYSRFSESYERTGIFSNWPATSKEFLTYDPETRKIGINGELGVTKGRLERYRDVYSFNHDFTTYTRHNVANFSDMPAHEYNVTLTGTGKKK